MARKVEYEFGVDMAAYAKSMRAALSTAGQLDKAFNNLLRSVRQLENAAIKMTVDTSALDRARADVNAIDGSTPDVTVNVDTSQLDRAESDVEALDGATPDVTVQTDASSLDTAESKVSALDGATPDVTVNVNTSSAENDIKQLSSKIDDLRDKSKGIQLTFDVGQIPNIIGGAAGAIANAPIVGAIQDQQAAARLLEARTDADIQRVEAVNAVYADAYGASRLEIAGVAVELSRMGVAAEDTQAALTSAFNVAAAEGLDVNEVIQAQRTLVSSGLATNFANAADILTVGFQEGANSGGDFLDTIREYSGQFAQAGVDAGAFISLITSGLEAGAYDTDKPADLFKESMIRVQEAAADAESVPAQALERIGATALAESYAAGEISGDEYVSGVIAAVKESGTSFDLFEILGTPSEDIGAIVTQNLEFDTVTITEGAAQEAANVVNDTLLTQWTSAIRTLEAELTTAMRVGGRPLTEILDNAKESLRTFTSELLSGKGIPESLEIALQAPGLSAELRNLQGTLGGFLIDFQLGLAAVLGIFDSAAGQSLRASAAAGAAGQLAFDLQFAANPEEITLAVNDALRRGVDPSAIAPAFAEATTAIGETMGRDAAESFAESVSQIQEGEFRVVFISNSGQRLELPLDPMEGETGEQALMRQYPYGSEARVTALREGGINNLAFDGEQVIQGFGDIAGIAEAAENAAATFGEAFVASDPISQAAVQANIAPALQGAWSEAMRNIQTEPDPALAQASADALVTLFNTSLENTGVEPVTLDELLGIINTGALESNIDEATGLFAEGATTATGQLTTQVNLTNDTIVESYRLMGVNAGVGWDTLALSAETSVDRQTAALDLLNSAVITTQNLLAGAGIDPAALAAHIFNSNGGGGTGGQFESSEHRATGGGVNAGQPYRVGERGWEYFIPGMDGAIIPHDISAALANLPMGGGGSSVVNNTVNLYSTMNNPTQAASVGAANELSRQARGYF